MSMPDLLRRNDGVRFREDVELFRERAMNGVPAAVQQQQRPPGAHRLVIHPMPIHLGPVARGIGKRGGGDEKEDREREFHEPSVTWEGSAGVQSTDKSVSATFWPCHL